MPDAAHRPAWRAGTPRTLGREGIGCVPDPVDRVAADGSGPAAVDRSTGSPTVMIGFCSFRRDNSSSSSHLCKLWRTRVWAGQTGYTQVVSLWMGGGKTRSPIHRRSPCTRLSTVVHRLSTGNPPTFSPDLWIVAGVSSTVIPRTFNSFPTGSRPSVDSAGGCPQASTAVHSVVPRVSPQAVGNWALTARVHPLPVDNELWTTSGRRCGHAFDGVA